MIVVDTSALIAIALREAKANACIKAIEAEPDILISAGTLAELLVVSARRGFSEDVNRLLDGFDGNAGSVVRKLDFFRLDCVAGFLGFAHQAREFHAHGLRRQSRERRP